MKTTSTLQVFDKSTKTHFQKSLSDPRNQCKIKVQRKSNPRPISHEQLNHKSQNYEKRNKFSKGITYDPSKRQIKRNAKPSRNIKKKGESIYLCSDLSVKANPLDLLP
jgi:hypothetical protein